MRTPLYEQHGVLGARMVPFGGWEMPLLYEGIVAEHIHTRKACSLFDVSHMGEFLFEGERAVDDLERLLTQRITSLETGQCRYGYLLNEQGGVLDDLMCYRLAEERFMLVVNAATTARDLAWIRQQLSPATALEDISASTAKLDLQGPLSRAVLKHVLAKELPDLRFFRCEEIVWMGQSCLLSRTGYTGEWGYELYVPASIAEASWHALLSHEQVRPAGLGARDTLRLEMGYPLYGHELTEDQTPLGVARGLFMDLTKPFIGREGVMREKERGMERVVVGLQLDERRAAREGDTVRLVDAPVGRVTSGSYAPSLGTAVALARVDREVSEPGQLLDVDARGTRLSGCVVPLPFYKEGSVRNASPPLDAP